MSENMCLDAALAELSEAGVNARVEHGGKHIHIIWQHDGSPRKHVVASTPSDRRAHLNERTAIRRVLKEDGLIEGEPGPASLPRLFLRDGKACVSSLEVAAHFSKPHKDVLRSIDRMSEQAGAEFAERNFAPSEYVDNSGRTLRSIDMTRDGFTLVVMSFTGPRATKWKVLYIDAFNQMEAQLSSVAARMDALEADQGALLELLATAKPKRKFVRPSFYRRQGRSPWRHA